MPLHALDQACKAIDQADLLIVESTGAWKLVVPASADFCPIKLKEPGITAAIRILKEKGLFPDEDEDDELVFGDDDFPLC